MKKVMVLCLGILMLNLFACEKENLADTNQGANVELKKGKGAPTALPCPTALMIQGMTPATSVCTVTDLNTNNTWTFTNGAIFPTLATGSSYFVDIQGPSAATFTWCSCGNNLGSVTIQSGGWFILNTSNNSAPYTACSF